MSSKDTVSIELSAAILAVEGERPSVLVVTHEASQDALPSRTLARHRRGNRTGGHGRPSTLGSRSGRAPQAMVQGSASTNCNVNFETR